MSHGAQDVLFYHLTTYFIFFRSWPEVTSALPKSRWQLGRDAPTLRPWAPCKVNRKLLIIVEHYPIMV